MADLETVVRPFAIDGTFPQPLLRDARYAPNVVLKIGRNSGTGKVLQGSQSDAITYYRDRQEVERTQP